MRKKDITGKIFGRLTVIRENGKNKWGKILWECKCSCGNITTKLGRQLNTGKVKSCGCLQKYNTSKANTKHGMHDSTEYRAWRTISDKNEYIQPEWKDFNVFYRDMGDRPSPKYMICKYNMQAGYSKENCYWGTSVKRLDISKFVNRKYGRLTILNKGPVNKFNQPRFECKCDCGNIVLRTTYKVISGEVKSCGCLQREVATENASQTQEEFIEKAINCHGNKYDYSLVKYVDNKAKVKIVCPRHGEFLQRPNTHLQHSGCLKCGKEITATKNAKTTEIFIEQSHKVHGDRFKYNLVEYVNAKTKVQIICSKHGAFLQSPNSHLNGNGCSKCGTAISKAETEIGDFISSLGVKIDRNRRDLLPPTKREADIFIPSKNLIIEYDGNYHHSEARASDKYNVLNKTKLAEDNGYRCMHIREDQWDSQKNTVKNLLKSQLGIYDNRIGARKTSKREITNDEYRNFCSYHLQGFRPAKYKQGLFYKDELVAAISYSEDGELIRYVVKHGWQIIGALPKLIKNENIKYSFCDLTFFTGNSYPKAGFKLGYITEPNYRYVKNKLSVTRNVMMKHKLKDKFPNFDESLTEVQNCANNGWYRLFDCGNAKYVMPST